MVAWVSLHIDCAYKISTSFNVICAVWRRLSRQTRYIVRLCKQTNVIPKTFKKDINTRKSGSILYTAAFYIAALLNLMRVLLFKYSRIRRLRFAPAAKRLSAALPRSDRLRRRASSHSLAAVRPAAGIRSSDIRWEPVRRQA